MVKDRPQEAQTDKVGIHVATVFAHFGLCSLMLDLQQSMCALPHMLRQPGALLGFLLNWCQKVQSFLFFSFLPHVHCSLFLVTAKRADSMWGNMLASCSSTTEEIDWQGALLQRKCCRMSVARSPCVC